jgi:hypothetical protein
VLPRTPQQTLLPGTGSVYLKQGLYRSNLVDFEQRLFVDGMTIAETREEVMPPPPVVVEPEQPVEPEPPVEPSPEEQEAVLTPDQGPTAGETVTFRKNPGCTTALPAPLALLGLGMLIRRRKSGSKEPE